MGEGLLGNGSVRQERIITRNGKLYGVELLNPPPPPPEGDIYNVLMLIGNAGKVKTHVNVLPETLVKYADVLEEAVKGKEIVFELVETDFPVLEIEKALKGRRLKLSIDDFGIGTSNFERIKIPNIESVKIDRLLWKEKPDLTRSLVKELQKEGLIVIAEKVETAEEFEKTKEMGFDAFQGWLWNRIK